MSQIIPARVNGAHESVYNNMPVWGLAAAGVQVPAEGSRRSAKGRLRQTDGADHVLE